MVSIIAHWLTELVPLANYTTISYCAGDPRDTETIVVDGFVFNAFARLGHALRQARDFWKGKYHNTELLLWADQVCINQSNKKERAHQVNFMGDIYSNAKQVLVSLSAEQDPRGGLAWLNRFTQHFLVERRSGADKSVRNEFQGHNDANAGTVVELSQAVSEVTDYHLGWDAFIVTVLRSQWWPRIWIRQEFLLAVRAYFMASFDYMEWEHLRRAIKVCDEAVIDFNSRKLTFQVMSSRLSSGKDVRKPTDFQSPCGLLNCFRCAIRYNKPAFQEDAKKAKLLLLAKATHSTSAITLLNLLDDVHRCEASDPRDLIYACIALTDHHYGVQPNYTEENTFVDVLADLATRIFQHGNLDLLHQAVSRHKGYLCVDVPSWVPDWRQFPDFGGYYVPERRQPEDPNIPAFVQVVKRDGHDRILKARGLFRESIVAKLPSPYVHVRYQIFNTSEQHEVHTFGDVRPGDECFSLYGAADVYILRRKAQYYELVGRTMSDPIPQPPCPQECQEIEIC
jgi:hypothetical protein